MAPSPLSKLMDKQAQVVLFSSTAIALYGYDQGMMSLINTNYDYLQTMGISKESDMVGIIVSVYYLGCTVGAVLFSALADAKGRKLAIFTCLATASLGNVLMFIAGLGGSGSAQAVMLVGRIVMGLGVGGIDAVVPVYTAELSEDDARGTALAKEFQANIFGLNMAFILNVALTHTLGKQSQWAWRTPIIVMQVYPLLLISGATLLPETPRWCVLKGKEERAKKSIKTVFGEDQVDSRMEELTEAHKQEEKDGSIGYMDMIWPKGAQFHPTCVTVMGQINQALTGYGAVSVYGPQIFQLLGFETAEAEFITLGNYVFYFAMMTFAWLLIDRKGRRWLLVNGAWGLAGSFAILALLGGLAMSREQLGIPLLATGIPGILVLYLATSTFGICWLVPPWLIPTELYPSKARANGAAISVIIWGLANFAVTLLTPIGFNNLQYYLFVIFAATNAFAGWWTYMYCPETGNRSFEENQRFFTDANDKDSWNVNKVDDGEFKKLPLPSSGDSNPDSETDSDPNANNRGRHDEERGSGNRGRDNRKKKKNKSKQKSTDNGKGKDTSPHGETQPLLGRDYRS